jgi:3'-phosphoadenosine 5'-phosphosulfate sulfotransferase (PAPS reductase)/FAD synthetase
LKRVEAYLGKNIRTLRNNRQGFADLLQARRGFLPSPQVRWCTEYLKIKPFEEYVGDDLAISYIAIRADETHRKGYLSTKPNIRPRYPFIEAGITKEDVHRILEESGLGLPDYYRWRSRSGCYFCFFQQKIEWVGLLENHPDLFQKAADFEKEDRVTGERYTWSHGESLAELSRPDRIAQIKAEAERRTARQHARQHSGLLIRMFDDQDESDEQPCLICHL